MINSEFKKINKNKLEEKYNTNNNGSDKSLTSEWIKLIRPISLPSKNINFRRSVSLRSLEEKKEITENNLESFDCLEGDIDLEQLSLPCTELMSPCRFYYLTKNEGKNQNYKVERIKKLTITIHEDKTGKSISKGVYWEEKGVCFIEFYISPQEMNKLLYDYKNMIGNNQIFFDIKVDCYVNKPALYFGGYEGEIADYIIDVNDQGNNVIAEGIRYKIEKKTYNNLQLEEKGSYLSKECLQIAQQLLEKNEIKLLLQQNIVKNLSSIKIPLWILTIMIFFHLFK